MAMLIFFLCLAASFGTVLYLVLRRLCWDTWTQWRQGQQDAQEDLRRAQHTQTLRREALDSVLAQIGQSDDQGRKAA